MRLTKSSLKSMDLSYINSFFHLKTRYVKRELRSLTSADKESFLDAAAEIWNNRQDEGVAKYGSKFTSVDTLVAVHSLASNDIMCDGFHEGSGFLTHHLALTNTFEAALRSIDPSVTLPYWDFSIEGEAVKYVLHLSSNSFFLAHCTPSHHSTYKHLRILFTPAEMRARSPPTCSK